MGKQWLVVVAKAAHPIKQGREPVGIHLGQFTEVEVALGVPGGVAHQQVPDFNGHDDFVGVNLRCGCLLLADPLAYVVDSQVE